MSGVEVCELAAWGFDDYLYRPLALKSCARLRSNSAAAFEQNDVLPPVPAELAQALASQRKRADLAYEMRGLHWSTGVIDLRALLSFQRRIASDPRAPRIHVPDGDNWLALLELCFAPEKLVDCTVQSQGGGVHVIDSTDPNLQVRTGADAGGLSLYAGSAFLEVAEYRGRWFLRDGYHRAYRLLQRGIAMAPAVIVYAQTLAELGATRPWFFAEEVLFSNDPPRLVDFLDASCTVRYTRPALLRRLRVTVEESFVCATQEGEPT